MEPLNIALIGCGTVGGGVARLLLEHPERLAARAGRRLVLKRVVVKDASKPRPKCVPSSLVTTDMGKVLEVVQKGVATADHSRFVEKLRKWEADHAK